MLVKDLVLSEVLRFEDIGVDRRWFSFLISLRFNAVDRLVNVYIFI